MILGFKDFSILALFGERCIAQFSRPPLARAGLTACDEFSLDSCGSSSGISSYSLHTLFQLDDLDHFSDCVFNEYGLHLYDVGDKCSTGHGLKRLGAMSYNPTAVKDVSHVQCFDDVLNVRTVSVCRCSEIILDSGSDVTWIPPRMAG